MNWWVVFEPVHLHESFKRTNSMKWIRLSNTTNELENILTCLVVVEPSAHCDKKGDVDFFVMLHFHLLEKVANNWKSFTLNKNS